jgi:hypothetical protein
MRVTNKDRVAHVVSCLFLCDEIVTEDCSSSTIEQYIVNCRWYKKCPNTSSHKEDHITIIKMQTLFTRLESNNIQLIRLGLSTVDIKAYMKMYGMLSLEEQSKVAQTECFDFCFRVIY